MSQMLLPMNCGVYLRPFLVAAELRHQSTMFRRKTALRLLHNYAMPFEGTGVTAPLQSTFTIDYAEAAPSWRGCPWCGGYDSRRVGGTWLLWHCNGCKARGQTGLNCAGRDGEGCYRCACGAVHTRIGPSGPAVVRGAVAQQVAVAAVEVTYVEAQWRG